MNFGEYQSLAHETAIYPEDKALEYTALGLTSEAGEVAGKIKKYIRDGEFDQTAVISELGDVLWYISELAYSLGYSLELIAAGNIAKLKSRADRGVISGSGDIR